MPRIQVLPSELINQIAAGEVVERPASVVKELVENAIDAGATQIDVRLENGGRKRIEVRDNGCGMSPADAALSLERHATSKIRNFDDLTRVRTLGFRGEALPSIASVSRFTLLTSDGSMEHALEVTVDPLTGKKTSRPVARDRGTTIIVDELFENVPARRKFLRSADAEFRSVAGVITSYALPEPARSFRLEHNGRVVLDLPPARDTRERFIQVLGRDAEEHLESVETTMGPVTVRGLVTRGLRFGSRRNQYFFVNDRLVKDRVLTHAANRAAEAFDFDGHPAMVVFIAVPAEMVDVNVHPAKTEVRFRDSSTMHVVVEQGIRRALAGPEEGSGLLRSGGIIEDAPSAFLPGPPASQTFFPPQRFDAPARTSFSPLFQSRPLVQPPPMAGAETHSTEVIEEQTHDLGDLQGRIIGQYRLSYLLLDTPGGLRLVDQHAAHERVLYERYLVAAEESRPVTQALLTPIIYDAGAAESAALESHLEELRAVGFDIEPFSGHSFAISGLPRELLREGVTGFLRKLIDASIDEKGSHLIRVREKVCASLACQAAIKVHRPLTGAEMANLTADLLATSNPFACPHGRPVIVDIAHIDIERHFHRK